MRVLFQVEGLYLKMVLEVLVGLNLLSSTEKFLLGVEKNIKNGMHYRDAIELSAVVEGGAITPLISQAMAKYQEAIHPKTELFSQVSNDEVALLSMGVLWEEEYYTPLEETKREVLAEAIYFVMKYGKEEDGLSKAIDANALVSGDVKDRELIINRILKLFNEHT